MKKKHNNEGGENKDDKQGYEDSSLYERLHENIEKLTMPNARIEDQDNGGTRIVFDDGGNSASLEDETQDETQDEVTEDPDEEKMRDFFVLSSKKLAQALDYFFIAYQMTKKSPQELKDITAIFYNAFRDEHIAAEVYEGLYLAAREFKGFFNLHSFRDFLQVHVRPNYKEYYDTSYNPHTGNYSYLMRKEIVQKYNLARQIGSAEFMKTLSVVLKKEMPFFKVLGNGKAVPLRETEDGEEGGSGGSEQ